MNYPFGIHVSDYKTKSFTRSLNVTFEILFYFSLFFLILSYSEFKKQELIVFIPLAIFLVLYTIKTKLTRKVNQKSIVVLITIIFILIFDKIDNTSITKYIKIPILARIPMPTVLLSITMLVYLVKTVFSGTYVLKINSFAKKFGISCLFVLVIATVFYPILYLQYQMSAQADLYLLNKIIKYCMIILLFQESVKNESLIKRLSLGLIVSVSIILLLDIIF